MEKKYRHLVKPLIAKRGPEGLYGDPLFWMESKDLEGVNTVFSYGFISEPGMCHPTTGEALVHPYDEVLVFAPCDAGGDILDLGAEISVGIGEENEEQMFHEPSAVIIPKGTPHGPVTIRRISKPIVHYSVGLSPDYRAELRPVKAKSRGFNYVHLIKRFRAARILFSRKLSSHQPSQSRRGGPGNVDQIVWMDGKDLEGFELNISWGFYSSPGIWHRMGRGGAHVHPVDEILFFVGLDPQNIHSLGAELEIVLGEEERHVINNPSAVVVPRNLPHCPLVTRWADRPYAHMHLYLGAKYETRWLHEEKE